MLDVDVEVPQPIRRVRKFSYHVVENATLFWFTIMEEHGATMTDDLLKVDAHKSYIMNQREASHKELQHSCAKVY
jgi:hypothetical protein